MGFLKVKLSLLVRQAHWSCCSAVATASQASKQAGVTITPAQEVDLRILASWKQNVFQMPGGSTSKALKT